jgi:hypothetical protein
MPEILPRIECPEVFIGFVAPVGADLDDVISHFSEYFRRRRYDIVQIKVTDVFKLLKTYISPKKESLKNVLFIKDTEPTSLMGISSERNWTPMLFWPN